MVSLLVCSMFSCFSYSNLPSTKPMRTKNTEGAKIPIITKNCEHRRRFRTYYSSLVFRYTLYLFHSSNLVRTLPQFPSRFFRINMVNMRYLISKGARTDARDFNGYTPFHLASLRKQNETAELLNPFPGEPLVQVVFPLLYNNICFILILKLRLQMMNTCGGGRRITIGQEHE